MADRYFVNSSNPNEIQTILIRKNEERIILIGTQQHRPITGPRSFIGSFVYDVNKWSKMMFVHQALRQVLLNKENDWTILLCTQGYGKLQIETIKQYFNQISKSDGSKTVRYIKEIINLNEILFYINRGDNKTNRNLYMIAELIFFCHGDVRGISPWMRDIPMSTDPYIDKKFAENIESYAFAPDAKIYSYACRTGLGNPKIDKKANGLDPMEKNSVAQALANATGATVYAYLRRTSYYDTLLNYDERDFIDAVHFYILKDRDKREYNGYTQFQGKPLTSEQQKIFYELNTIWNEGKYLVEEDILYPKGARHPVTYDEIPEGVTSNMKTFWKM
ncbi:MAG: hypothetical protein SOT80_00180 [Candidatus Pseudoruminococcus sp.]|nr:hypothetical protein [Candidatus Pseudoruminococcus sp.]